MATKRRRAGGDDGPKITVKALKLTGRKNYLLRWTDPVTGRSQEQTTDIQTLDRLRRRAMQAAADLEAKLQERLDAGLPAKDARRRQPAVTVEEICKAHLDWVKRERSLDLYKQRKSLLDQFCAGVVGTWEGVDLPGFGSPMGKVRATFVTPSHVEQHLSMRTLQPASRRAIVVALKATWNWAARPKGHKLGGGGLLPEIHNALASMSRGKLGPRDLTEVDLPTIKEIEAVIRWSSVATSKIRAGTGRWRRRRPDEFYETVEARVLGDMMKVYHATGARTGELCAAVVRDFMPSTQQICLGKHKRTATQHNPTVRNIQLGQEALEAVRRNADGRHPSEPLFRQASGAAWTQNLVNRHFRGVRKLAAERDQPIRDHITPYSFRHLYISELLMIGTPVFQVAKMAGTSPGEIERTYGHFSSAPRAAWRSAWPKATTILKRTAPASTGRRSTGKKSASPSPGNGTPGAKVAIRRSIPR